MFIPPTKVTSYRKYDLAPCFIFAIQIATQVSIDDCAFMYHPKTKRCIKPIFTPKQRALDGRNIIALQVKPTFIHPMCAWWSSGHWDLTVWMQTELPSSSLRAALGRVGLAVCGQVACAAVRVRAGTDLRCQVKAFRRSAAGFLISLCS